MPIYICPVGSVFLSCCTHYLELTSFSSSQCIISSFIHHSTQNPPFPTIIHSLIHTDLMVNGWHRFEPLPGSHVPICLGGALIVTCNPGRRHRHGLDREHDVWKPHFHFHSFHFISSCIAAPRLPHTR